MRKGFGTYLFATMSLRKVPKLFEGFFKEVLRQFKRRFKEASRFFFKESVKCVSKKRY